MPKKVFVSGCFGLLHSAHIAFLQEAATLGDLHVALGSDTTVYELKGRLPINTEAERLYLVSEEPIENTTRISIRRELE